MKRKQLESILTAMEGMTYDEWLRFEIGINDYFSIEINREKYKVPLNAKEAKPNVKKILK